MLVNWIIKSILVILIKYEKLNLIIRDEVCLFYRKLLGISIFYLIL